MNLLNLVQFVQLPFVIIPLLKIYNSKEIMSGYKISKCKFIFIIVLSVLIQIFNIFSIQGVVKDSKKVWVIIVWILITIHTLFIGNIIF